MFAACSKMLERIRERYFKCWLLGLRYRGIQIKYFHERDLHAWPSNLRSRLFLYKFFGLRLYFCYQENVDIDLHILGTEGFEKNILDHVRPLRDLIIQGHANDNVTCDLQTKAFQGHYFSHKKLVELRNISLIDTVNFVWYDYRTTLSTISSHFLIPVTSKPRLFKVKTSNTRKL